MSVDASITCQEVVELLSAYLDGELDPDDPRPGGNPPRRLRRLHDGVGGVPGDDQALRGLTVEQVDETQRRTLLEAFRDWTAGD